MNVIKGNSASWGGNMNFRTQSGSSDTPTQLITLTADVKASYSNRTGHSIGLILSEYGPTLYDFTSHAAIWRYYNNPQWGTATLNVTANVTSDHEVSFPKPFSIQPGVVVSLYATSSSGANLVNTNLQVISTSTTKFKVRAHHGFTGQLAIIWIACENPVR